MGDRLHPRCPQCGYRKRALMGSMIRCSRCAVVLLLDARLTSTVRPAWRLTEQGTWMQLHGTGSEP
jgi:hypothetical protein